VPRRQQNRFGHQTSTGEISLGDRPAPNAQCPMPNAQCPMPNAQCPMPNAQCPMPNAQCPMPNAQCPIFAFNRAACAKKFGSQSEANSISHCSDCRCPLVGRSKVLCKLQTTSAAHHACHVAQLDRRKSQISHQQQPHCSVGA